MPEEEIQFATEEDLGPEKAFNVIDLPVLGKKVRVRMLGTAEVASLSYLPDTVGFSLMAAKFQDEDERQSIDAGEFILGNLKYQSLLAHVAVMKGMQTGAMTTCKDCGLEHPPPLWSKAQAGRLDQSDLEAISGAAVGIQALQRLRPFSTEETPSDTPASASSGG